MAHLEVEPKPKRPLWVWIMLVIILIILALLLLRKREAEHGGAKSATVKDSTTAIAATSPDWKSVDLNLDATADADIKDNDIETRTNGTYTIYSLGENILFPTGQNEISEKGQNKLKMISEILGKRFKGATIGVFGSTDSTGPADQNKELGKQRATSVKEWLISTGQIPSSAVSVQSLGESEPVATNTTTTGRKQNRNVSIVVFPKQ